MVFSAFFPLSAKTRSPDHTPFLPESTGRFRPVLSGCFRRELRAEHLEELPNPFHTMHFHRRGIKPVVAVGFYTHDDGHVQTVQVHSGLRRRIQYYGRSVAPQKTRLQEGECFSIGTLRSELIP